MANQNSVSVPSNDEYSFLNFEQKIATQRALTMDEDSETAFYAFNLDRVVALYDRWCRLVPRVRPYYAVKSCNLDILLRTLHTLGCGFDCASANELSQVIESVGCKPSSVIYAHTVKPKNMLKLAKRLGVKRMTFDNEFELLKIKELCPEAELVLRIAVADHDAKFQLKDKFGCHPDQRADALLDRAAELGLTVTGISFHIGSNAQNAHPWADGIGHARRLFDYGIRLGHPMTFLDLGGGFIGRDKVQGLFTLEDAAPAIMKAIDDLFPATENVTIIAEPGTYFSETIGSLLAQIYAKTDVDLVGYPLPTGVQSMGYKYYINAATCGLGSFNCRNSHSKNKLLEEPFLDLEAVPLFLKKKRSPLYCSSIWGPRVDPKDKAVQNCLMPEMHEGDWIRIENMGSYTLTISCEYAGFDCTTVYWFIHEKNLLVE